MQTTRQRLMATAADLFYRDGITATGVDTIAARAQVSKPTLYAQFGSKAALVAAVLRRRDEQRRGEIEAYVAAHATIPRDRLLATFDWLREWHSGAGGRGCPFLNAAAELAGPEDGAGRDAVREYKRWWRALLARLAREAGVRDDAAEELASHLLFLLDGASERVLVEGDAGAAGDARRAATVLIDAALA